MNSTRTLGTQDSFTTPSIRADSVAGDSTERDNIQRKETMLFNKMERWAYMLTRSALLLWILGSVMFSVKR